MKNLAGCEHSDRECIRELERARIPWTTVANRYEEPQTYVVGRLGNMLFKRAWYYWIVRCRIPLKTAWKLYENPVGKTDIRVAGHCGCPPPEDPWVNWYDEEDYIIDTNMDQIELCLRQAKKFNRPFILENICFMEKEERDKLIAEGKIHGYVESYHIDSEVGLRIFADETKCII